MCGVTASETQQPVLRPLGLSPSGNASDAGVAAGSRELESRATEGGYQEGAFLREASSTASETIAQHGRT